MKTVRIGRVALSVPAAAFVAVGLFVLAYLLFISHPVPESGVGSWRTTNFGSAFDDPKSFLTTVLNAVTLAGLYFIVASGFTLVFGLMRVVNMAHGSFFLLGGYIALKLQRHFVGDVGGGGALGGGLTSSDVTFFVGWLLPLVLAAVCVAILGLAVQQVFLRWNQGQELRQALITIALSIIVADQMIARLPFAADIAWPDQLGADKRLHIGGFDYSWSRLFILGLACLVGIALWLWLQKTRTGMVIRAGVDDRHMVSALGVNIQLAFAIAFLVGAGLAGSGGVIGGSFGGLDASQVPSDWLLNSLVVVIIGGMGSLAGAAVGALLYGFVDQFASLYLPTVGDNCCTQYSSIFTFALLAVVLAVRPYGLFGRPA